MDGLDPLAKTVPFVVGGSEGNQAALDKNAPVSVACFPILVLNRGNLGPAGGGAARKVNEDKQPFFEFAHGFVVRSNSFVLLLNARRVLGRINTVDKPLSKRFFPPHPL